MSIAALHTWPAASAAPTAAMRNSARTPKSVRTLLWTMVLLLGAEGGLRVRAFVKQGNAGPVAAIYQDDSTLGRVPKPGATIAGTDRQVSINRWGFRGSEVIRPKPAGVTRIAALGDSTTFGLEASSDDAVWVERLTQSLNTSKQPRYDAINAAVPGFTMTMSFERLRRDVEPFDPDVIVLLQTATDIAAHSRRQFRIVNHGDADRVEASLARRLQEHSLLVNLVRQNAAPWLARWAPQRRFDRLDERGITEFEANLRAIVDECRSHSRSVVLCTTPRSFGEGSSVEDQHTLAATALANNPSLSLPGLNDAYDRYNDAIRRVARSSGMTLVDLAERLPQGAHYFVDATHLNDAGHTRVAELIAERITARSGALRQDEASP